jgi:hypothetical protein
MPRNQPTRQALLRLLFCATLLLPTALVQAETLIVHEPGVPTDPPVPDNWSDGAEDDDNPGSFFDLVAGANIDITSFSAYSYAAAGGSPGDPYTIEVWTKSGSYVGSETTPGDWTLLQSFSGNDADDATMETLALSTPLGMTAGETIGVAVIGTLGGLQWSDQCGGSTTYTQGDLTLNINDMRGMDDGFAFPLDDCKSFIGLVTFGLTPVPSSTPIPTAAPAPPEAVPTMPLYMLVLTMLGLLAMARRR